MPADKGYDSADLVATVGIWTLSLSSSVEWAAKPSASAAANCPDSGTVSNVASIASIFPNLCHALLQVSHKLQRHSSARLLMATLSATMSILPSK